jgi:four helix bundle protein
MSDIADQLRQRTLRYALRILKFCQDLPDTWPPRELGRQLLRAGMGVAGNYWSACRGRSDREFIAKLGVAVDEAEESLLWLTAIEQGGIRADAETTALLTEGGEVRAILSKSCKTARENRRRKMQRRQVANASTRQLAKPPTL